MVCATESLFRDKFPLLAIDCLFCTINMLVLIHVFYCAYSCSEFTSVARTKSELPTGVPVFTLNDQSTQGCLGKYVPALVKD